MCGQGTSRIFLGSLSAADDNRAPLRVRPHKREHQKHENISEDSNSVMLGERACGYHSLFALMPTAGLPALVDFAPRAEWIHNAGTAHDPMPPHTEMIQSVVPISWVPATHACVQVDTS